MSIPRVTEMMEEWGKGSVSMTASGSTAIIYTKTSLKKDWKSLAITNDDSTDLQFIVNNITVTVKPREQFDDKFEYFKQVEILTNVSYRLILRA